MGYGKQVPDLGPVEFQLLQILWRTKSATAGSVLTEYNAGAERPLKYTTVMTLLTRMVEKGVLEADRERQPFFFSPSISQERMVGQRVRDFVDLFFEGRAVELAVRLVEAGDLSPESIERLERILRHHKESHSLPEEGSI